MAPALEPRSLGADIDPALAWRLEAAFDAAWPCLGQTLVGGWLCKRAGGVSRRSNSANAQSPGAALDDARLEAIAQVYAAARQPAYVRVLSVLDPGVDRCLDRAGWTLEGATLTLTGPLDAGSEGSELAGAPSSEWLAALDAINGRGPEAGAAFADVLGRIAIPAAFAAVRRDGRIASAAYAALHGDWLCIEAVATDPQLRGQGLAAAAVSGLMAWGRANGGARACLQVAADNAAGQALYRKLGLGREAYRYHYRRAP